MFTEKLNKKQDGSVYVIEEEKELTDGKYEGLLEHDNVNKDTIRVYTGSMLSGDEITDVIKSVPADTPWNTYIRIFSDCEKVYITYETPGDTVEADDINFLQDEAVNMRETFEEYGKSGHIEGGTF